MIRTGLAMAALAMMPFPAAASDPAAPETPQGLAGSAPPPADASPPPANAAPPSPEASAPIAPPPSSPPPVSAPLPPAPEIAVIDQSLVSMLTDTGALTSTPTTSIPYAVGKSCYHWAVKYKPVEGEVVLTEELRLPGPARNWDFTGTDTEVNPQRSGAITTRRFNGSTGGATAGWCVAKDDPMGSYRYTIRQGDREIARFDFTVGDLL